MWINSSTASNSAAPGTPSSKPPDLDALIPQATALLRGECELPGLERDEIRERILAGYRHILIDEYQDIDQPQYDLISAIAGRTLDARQNDARLTILAVGDDDQNIYSFRGANIRFIRRFERDYHAHIHYLVENYRSDPAIIDTANQLIRRNRDRMKTGHPICINAARRHAPSGEPVRILSCRDPLHQARLILHTIETLRAEASPSIAVFAHTHEELHPILAALETRNIPCTIASGRNTLPLLRLRETQALLNALHQRRNDLLTPAAIHTLFRELPESTPDNPWCALLNALLHEWRDYAGTTQHTGGEAIEFITEALVEQQRETAPQQSICLSTVHAAKGLEFDAVLLLGAWKNQRTTEQQEEERRLYYVGMTRARKTLLLCELAGHPNPHTAELAGPNLTRLHAPPLNQPPDELLNRRCHRLDLSSIWLGYSATAPNAPYVRQEIAKLHPGDTVQLEASGTRVFITNPRGRKIGALSSAASETWRHQLTAIRTAHIYAILQWRKEWETDPLPDLPDTWEIPLIEIRT